MVSVTLPWELVEEILHRLPPLSLIRFKVVCKQWNSLFDDDKFAENHLVQWRPQFIFQIDSNIYSVSVNFNDLQIEVYELTIEIPCPRRRNTYDFLYPDIRTRKLMNYVDCDGLLFCLGKNTEEVLIWNPWLEQIRILPIESLYRFTYVIGYDNKKRYKLCALVDQISVTYEIGASIEYHDLGIGHSTIWSNIKSNLLSVSGNLYWADVDVNNGIFIRSYCFSTERSTKFCRVPYKYEENNVLVLAVYRKDRLSLLNLCNKSSTITVWLTKRGLEEEEEEVVWIKLMRVSIPNFPKISSLYWFHGPLTYFLHNEDDKRLAICCYDVATHHAYIYIVRGIMFKKIKLDHYNIPSEEHNDPRDDILFSKLHTYIPSFIRPSSVNKI